MEENKQFLDYTGITEFHKLIKLNFSDINHRHDNADLSKDGYMSKEDKLKLDGIASGATKVVVDSALSETSTNPVQNKVINTALSGKSDKSHNHDGVYAKNTFANVKVSGTTIAADTTGDTLELVAGSNVTLTPDATNDKITITAKDTTYNDVTTSTHGLMTAADKKKLDGIASGATKVVVDSALSETSTNPVQNKVINTALSGKADLGTDGKVLSSQLPSYVDDVIEGYYYDGKFYKEAAHTTEIPGETGKIYVDLSTNKTYRWSGSAFVVISETLALGETSSTAYRGDRGKIAYDHSQSAHAPSNAEENQNAFSNVKVSGTTIAADSKTDTLELVAGSNVTLTPDATNDKITIAAKDTTYDDATQSTHGLMSTTDKKKLDGIASGAEVNQNAFSNVKVSGTTIEADSKTDTLELVAGDNVTLTPDATNDKITIAAKDTHYTNSLTIKGNGTSAVVFTQNSDKALNITGSGKASVTATDGVITVNAAAGTYEETPGSGSISTSSNTWKTPLGYASLNAGHVLTGSTVTIPAATASVDGYMTKEQASKLSGIESGAQVNKIETVKVNGTALTITDKAVNVVVPAATVTGVKSGDKVIKLNGTVLESELTFTYDSTAKTINLKGVNGTSIGTVDCSDFIKDGMLYGTQVFKATASTQTVTIKQQSHQFTGLTANDSYLALCFKIDGKTVSYDWDIINVNSLVDVYKADESTLTLNSTNKTFSVKSSGISTTQLANGAITNDKVASGAAIAQSKLALDIKSGTGSTGSNTKLASEKYVEDEISRAKGVEGLLSNLTTTSKTNLVSAINEVKSKTDELQNAIDAITSLTKQQIIDAWNAANV